MKKVFFLCIAGMLLSASYASAQLKYGGGLSYGTEIENIGIDFRGEYPIMDKISGVGDILIFLPKDDVSMYEINANGHYAVNEMFYGLAGLNYTHYKFKSDPYSYMGVPVPGVEVSDGNIGLNIGGGASFGEMFFGEIKYVVSDYDQLVLTIGILLGGK